MMRASRTIKRHPEVEAALPKMWQECLAKNEIGINDNSIHLGGTSLQASQLIGRCNEQFKINLPISILLERPTIERLAEAVRSVAANKPRSRLVQLARGRGTSHWRRIRNQ